MTSKTVLLFAAFGPVSSTPASLIVDWSLLTMIWDYQGDHTSRRALTAPSPYELTHMVTFDDGSLTSTSTYDFAWDDAGGRFDVTFEHWVAGPERFASSTGTLFVTDSQRDLLVNLSFEYSYQLEAGDIGAYTAILVRTDDFEESLVWERRNYSTPWGPPPYGTHRIEPGPLLLTAGHTWRIGYSAKIESFSGPNVRGAGTGRFHLDITAVPEPASLALLASAILALLASRRREGRCLRKHCSV